MVSEEPQVSLNARFTMNQASEILGIHRNTLRRYTNAGKLGIRCNHTKINNRKYITGAELIRFWRSYM